jgi:hypothetical protein
MEAMMNELLISLDDYTRIFRTIYSTLLNENAKIHHSCIYFSLIGAAILDGHYKLKPKVYMGVAAYMVDDKSKSVLTFAEKDGDRLVCSEKGFHSWIMANDVVIDFTSPLFPTMINTPDGSSLCEPKMFQRNIETMAKSPHELAANGDFFMSPDAKLTNDLVDAFIGVPLNMDLLNICSSWYRRMPSEMSQMIGITDGRGGLKSIHLQKFEVSGTW